MNCIVTELITLAVIYSKGATDAKAHITGPETVAKPTPQSLNFL